MVHPHHLQRHSLTICELLTSTNTFKLFGAVLLLLLGFAGRRNRSAKEA